jgi:prepilin-type N-terminal cleavage/methylation domain-containing protein
LKKSAFTLIEVLITLAVLVIVFGVMVSLAHHVRLGSADELTQDILHRLDVAMDKYVTRYHSLPQVPALIPDPSRFPEEASLQETAGLNNEGFVRALKADGLLSGQFNDLSIAYFDEVHVRDAWGSPIVLMTQMHPAIGMTPKGWFFFSAGPDHQYLTRDDNLYSYEKSPGR